MKAEIVTYTGKLFDILNPKPELVCIEDIAHSLANQCRYTGHTKEFYSVAQHSVLMAVATELPGDPMQKLLHDSAEAYFGDIVSPLKRKIYVCEQGYSRRIGEVEVNLLRVIQEALGVNLDLGPDIKEADRRMLVTEVRDLMSAHPVWDKYIEGYKPLKHIIPWTPTFAERQFLHTYHEILELGVSG
ncbi:hypothetical protein LCGC14_1012800 [marine sediment metagenome]|uniref:HD domain-containing protein n=1 Tax=marine sediment metagenome TaxID=412755 RepID=A0A0F9QI48_9ZZZZ